VGGDDARGRIVRGVAELHEVPRIGAIDFRISARDSNAPGRAAERILFNVMCKKGDIVPNNTHFDTTRANCEFVGATALDLPIPERRSQPPAPVQGNMDVERLAEVIARKGRRKFAGDADDHQQFRRGQRFPWLISGK